LQRGVAQRARRFILSGMLDTVAITCAFVVFANRHTTFGAHLLAFHANQMGYTAAS